MTTIMRTLKLKKIKPKWESDFWQKFNKQTNELINPPENFGKTFLPYIANIVHKAVKPENKKISFPKMGQEMW